MAKICGSCGSQVDDSYTNCPNCGALLAQPTQPAQPVPPMQQPNPGYGQPMGQQPMMQQPYGYQDPNLKSKMVAGLLGIFLGGWGVHNFYLGNTSKGAIQIVVSIVTCGIGSIWGFIEGIMILCGSIKTDAQGRPLKD